MTEFADEFPKSLDAALKGKYDHLEFKTMFNIFEDRLVTEWSEDKMSPENSYMIKFWIEAYTKGYEDAMKNVPQPARRRNT